MITNNTEWNEDAIIRRRNWIVDFIINEIVTLPDEFKNKNNYSKKESRRFSFAEHGLIGKEIRFINDKSISVKVINDREVEFEGAHWKLSPLVCELETRRGTVNNSKSYQGPVYWEYNGINITEYHNKD